MSKRLFKTMVAVLAIAAAATGPVRAQSTTESFTITFKTTGSESDGAAAQTTIGGIIANGADYVSEVNATKVYQAKDGYGIKLGSSSATGSLTLTLANAVENVTSIVVNARQYGDGTSERTLQIQGDNYTTTDAFADYTYTYTTPATVSTITLATTTKRAYIKSVTVNYTTSTGGGGSTPAVPHTVTFAEGTEDVGNWSITPAEAATNTGVTAGTVVTVKYNGTRRINSIEAMVDGPSLTTPLTIEALTAGTIVVNISGPLPTLSTGMKYAVNGGEKTLITTTTTIDVNAGDKVQFYGNGTSTTEYGNNPEVNLRGTAETKVYGNIMSLLDETGYETATAISGNYVFYALFRYNANLKDASGLLLPATTLAEACYSDMFHDCTGLTEAPALPAQTLVSRCYNGMFYGCNNLSSVTCLATSGIDASSSTSYWLENAGTDQSVTTKTFNAVSTAEWPTSVNGIPEGWTRQAIGAQSTPEPVTLVPTGNTNEWTLTMPADNMLLMVNYAPAPTLHTVRFAEGMSGWQVQDVTAATSATAPAVLQNVMAGDSLVVTAPATLPGKVKSVKAVKYVPPAATVTTAPTATGAIIEAGSTAALVNAGAANGGTMMYAVTTTSVQPASTADFSATVPTAEGRTAGTYYVWFYAKADADHSDSEISATGIEVTIAAAEITVTINQSDWVMGSSFTKDGVTVSAGMIDAMEGNLMSGGTFSTTLGNFTKIEVTCEGCDATGTGWSGNYSKKTWAGTPASTVSFSGNFMGMGGGITIVCTIVPTN